MRRLVALGLGCLVSVTASSEDLLTIFDQAVVNDPQVREAEYTRKATHEATPTGLGGVPAADRRPLDQEQGRMLANSSVPAPGAVDPDDPDPNSPVGRPAAGARSGSSEPEYETLGAAAHAEHLQLGPARRAEAGRPRRRAGRRGLRRRAAGPGGARGHALLRRARRAGQRAGPAGLARCHFAPARAGRQAFRGRPDRHHRRAGSARRARHGGRGPDRRQARSSPPRRSSCARSPTCSTRCSRRRAPPCRCRCPNPPIRRNGSRLRWSRTWR